MKGLQSQDATEDEDSRQDRRQIPSRQGGKGRGSRGKEVVQLLFAVRSFLVSGTFRLRCGSGQPEVRILPNMTPILAKVTAIEKRGDQYQGNRSNQSEISRLI